MVNILKWDDSLSTGFGEVDNQHKKLIAIIEDVHQNMQAEGSEYALRMAKDLKRLTDYTEYHFSEEEQFMKSKGYPGLEDHQKAHKAFVEEVFRLIKTLSHANPDDGFQFYRFLGSWLLNHIAKQDRAWADWIKEHS
jgi:hemerythrin